MSIMGTAFKARLVSGKAHAPEGRRRSGLVADQLERGARHHREDPQTVGRQRWSGIGRLHHCHRCRHFDAGWLPMGRTPQAGVRHAECGRQHRAVQFHQGLCLPPYFWHQSADGGFRTYRLYRLVGPQPQFNLASARDARRRCQGARSQVGGCRSAPLRFCVEGGSMATRAPRQRRVSIRAASVLRRRRINGYACAPAATARWRLALPA